MPRNQNLKPADFTLTKYEVENHVATITLNRPEIRNALNFLAYDELEVALLTASSDMNVRCVIVTGADPAFCSGDDVREIMAGPTAVSREERPPITRHRPTPASMAALDCEVPVIAAVNGAAIGWGMELAIYADIRIASEKAKFSEMFVKRGLCPDVGAFYKLPAIVGPAKAAELMLTGDIIDGAEALRIGLVSYTVPHDELMAKARGIADKIAANPPLAVRTIKEGLRRTAYGDPHEIGSWAIENIFKLMKTADHREGVASFLEKREPVFTGR